MALGLWPPSFFYSWLIGLISFMTWTCLLIHISCIQTAQLDMPVRYTSLCFLLMNNSKYNNCSNYNFISYLILSVLSYLSFIRFFIPLYYFYRWWMYIILLPLIYPNNNTARWAGLRESDYSKVTQWVFIPKAGLNLTVSWFLGPHLYHNTKLAGWLTPLFKISFPFFLIFKSSSLL